MVFWIDDFLLQYLQSFANPALDVFFLAISELGNPLLWLFVAAFIYWLDRENDSFFLVNLITFSAAASGILKFAVARPRPSAERFRVIAGEVVFHSFPSAHSALVAGAYSYFSPVVKRGAKLVLGLGVLLVLLSRIYLGAHFPTDVLGGVVIGVIVGKANFSIKQKLQKARFHLTKLEEELGIVLVVFAAVAAIILLQEYSLAESVIGFYAGFFTFKLVGQPSGRTGGRMLLAKQGLGFAVLAAIVLLALLPPAGSPVLGGLLYFASGIWVSFLWPVLWAKIAGKQ